MKVTKINVRRAMRTVIPGRTYATHGLDSYPAKMVPHLARYAIEEVSRPGQALLDPFSGCGTVLVEALVSGRNSIGIDVNPVAVLLAKAKSAVYDTREFLHLARRTVAAAGAKSCATPSEPQWLNYWFTPRTLTKLLALRSSVQSLRSEVDSTQGDLLMACLVLSVRKCSKADPRSPKPFISKRAREVRLGRHFDSFGIFTQVADDLAQASDDLRARLPSPVPEATAVRGDARCAAQIITAQQIDAVVTSPPYLSAQDYFRSSKLELAVAGLWRHGIERDLGQRIIGSGRGRRKASSTTSPIFPDPAALRRLAKANPRAAEVVRDYLSDMSRVFRSLTLCTNPRAKCCFVIGDSTIRGIRLPVHSWVVRIAEQTGFSLYKHDVDFIRDRRIPPRREGHESVIDREHLLFLCRTRT